MRTHNPIRDFCSRFTDSIHQAYSDACARRGYRPAHFTICAAIDPDDSSTPSDGAVARTSYYHNPDVLATVLADAMTDDDTLSHIIHKALNIHNARL